MKTNFFLFAIFFSFFWSFSVDCQILIAEPIGNRKVTFTISTLPELTVSGSFTDDLNVINPPYYDVFISYGDNNSDTLEIHYSEKADLTYKFRDILVSYEYTYCGDFIAVLTIMDRKHDPPPPPISITPIIRTSFTIPETECSLGQSSTREIQTELTNDRIIDIKAYHSFLKKDRIIEVAVSYKAESPGLVDISYDAEFFTPQEQQTVKYPEYSQTPNIHIPRNPLLNSDHLISIVDNEDIAGYENLNEERRLFYYFKCKQDSIDYTHIKAKYIFIDNIYGPVQGYALNIENFIDSGYDRVIIEALEPIDPNSLTLMQENVTETNDVYTIPFEFIFENSGEGRSKGSLISLKQLEPNLFYDIDDFILEKYDQNGHVEIKRIDLPTAFRPNDMLNSDTLLVSEVLSLSINQEAKLTFTAQVNKQEFLTKIEEGQKKFFEACQVFIDPPVEPEKLDMFNLNLMTVCVQDSLLCPKTIENIIGLRHSTILQQNSCFDEERVKEKCLNPFQKIIKFFSNIFN